MRANRLAFSFTVILLALGSTHDLRADDAANLLVSAKDTKTVTWECGSKIFANSIGDRTDDQGNRTIYQRVPRGTKVQKGQHIVDPSEYKRLDLQLSPEDAGRFEVLASELCGGTSDCASKTCQSEGKECKKQTSGCSCQKKSS